MTNLLIQEFYKNIKKKMVFVLGLGSLDIIGSPVNLFKNLGIGVVEFFEKPIKGFINGPLEGIEGISKGTQSLIKNTVSAILDSTGRVLGSVANGLCFAANDNTYTEIRNEIKNRQNLDILDGLHYSIKIIGNGIF